MLVKTQEVITLTTSRYSYPQVGVHKNRTTQTKILFPSRIGIRYVPLGLNMLKGLRKTSEVIF